MLPAPPPPELTTRSRSWERRRKRRKRRFVFLGVVAVVMSAVVCTVTALFVYRTGAQGPETPKAAADQLLRSMSQNSINEFEQALCEAKRSQAGATLREFNSGLVDVGQELQTINWRITKETRRSSTEVELDVGVTFVVADKRSRATSNLPWPMRLQVLENNGWYICNIEVLTL
ncbi:hypothetical protein [Cryptosporangium sp. NPDC048952]|uniref:hypothetical protein n=1 Tax=Cryptosporangium sp. NPDC048952 TaxID=3363961 RepID=UPI0037215218